MSYSKCKRQHEGAHKQIRLWQIPTIRVFYKRGEGQMLFWCFHTKSFLFLQYLAGMDWILRVELVKAILLKNNKFWLIQVDVREVLSLQSGDLMYSNVTVRHNTATGGNWPLCGSGVCGKGEFNSFLFKIFTERFSTRSMQEKSMKKAWWRIYVNEMVH